MGTRRSIEDRLCIELTSAELRKALSEMMAAGIAVNRLEGLSELTCRFCIKKEDYWKLRKICEKRGDRLRILRRTGLSWTTKKLWNRPLLIIGATLLFFSMYFFPTRIFFVQVEGNEQIPNHQLLAAAEECGIRFGASRREVRSEKIKNALLSAVPLLQWAGVNTSGCTAIISVRERNVNDEETEAPGVSHIVAERDGYILSVEPLRGSAVCQIGQTVKQGQILISGYTDCGIAIQATRAIGDVYAQTNHKIETITPKSYLYRKEEKATKKKISLIWRKKRIILWKDSGISDTTCGRMYEEYYITLPGGFELPFALCLERYTEYNIASAEYTPEDLKEDVCVFSDNYLLSKMVAGQIMNRFLSVENQNGVVLLKGSYICTEMIGREQIVKIGDTNGKIG